MAKGRSPNYPGLNLETAIERVTRIYRSEHKHTAAQIAILNDLGYSSASGRALAQLGALRAYGLLEGRGDAIKVSDDAVAIVEFSAEPQNTTRLEALRKCAFAPSIFEEMETQFGYQPPSDATMRHWLVAKDYLSKAADEVIQTYRENLEFLSRLNVSYTGRDGSKDPERPPATTIKVGDYVHWESQGALQFQEPKRVRELSDDGGWAFVEGSDTGMPVNQLTVESTPEQKKHHPPPAEPPKPKTLVDSRLKPQSSLLQDNFTLPEGQIIIQWPSELTAEGFQDFKDWLAVVERKIQRSIPGSSIRHRAMREKLQRQDALDVSKCERNADGDYILPVDLQPNREDPKDYCDAEAELWIHSIGKNKTTGEVVASVTGRFYQNPGWECVWLK